MDRILVQRVKAEAKTAGGLLLPESAIKELNEARVMAVGPGAYDKEGKRLQMSVKEGDRVLIPQVSLPIKSRRGPGQSFAGDVIVWEGSLWIHEPQETPTRWQEDIAHAEPDRSVNT